MRPKVDTPVFVSPVATRKKVANGKRQQDWYFAVLPAGQSNILTLTYANPSEAKEARRQIVRTDHAHIVPSWKLFHAIRQALGAQFPENQCN